MEKDLQIKGIKVKNFKGINTIDVTFDKDHTRIIGLNGDGKTTLKDVVQACFIGISQKGSKGELVGERFRFIGSKSKSADFWIKMEDMEGDFTVIVTNHMTKDMNGIKIEASDGRELTRAWLQKFFNAAFLSAENFVAHTPKEQALLLGINTADYDAKIAQGRGVAKQIRSDIKAIGDVQNLIKVERVSLKTLSDEKDAAISHNREQESMAVDIEESSDELANQNNRVQEVKDEIKGLELTLAEEEETLKRLTGENLALPVPGSLKVAELISINQQIDDADSTNRQAEAYESNEVKRASKDKAITELADAQADIGKVNELRTNYIKSFEFPLKGLEVDEEGGLLLDGRRINSYSKGEREVIVANLKASQNPNFKTAMIDEFQSLDEVHQEKIVSGLIDKGFNVITFEVGDKKKGDGSILLKGCAVVGNDITRDDDRPTCL